MPVSRTFDQFGRRINQDETFKKKPNQSPTRNYQKSYFDTVSSTNKPTQMPTNDISPRSSQSMKRTTSFDNFNSLENTTKRPSQKFNEIRKKEVIVTTDSSVTHGSVRMIKKNTSSCFYFYDESGIHFLSLVRYGFGWDVVGIPNTKTGDFDFLLQNLQISA